MASDRHLHPSCAFPQETVSASNDRRLTHCLKELRYSFEIELLFLWTSQAPGLQIYRSYIVCCVIWQEFRGFWSYGFSCLNFFLKHFQELNILKHQESMMIVNGP